MKIGTADTAKQVFIIAEIGNNHEGSVDRAREMIAAAAAAGVDAVKFQAIEPEQLVTSADAARLAQLRRFRLSPDQYRVLAETAKAQGVTFLCTPFHPAAVDWLDPLVPAFKIASSDNTFSLLLRRVAATGKPLLMSAGLADLATLRSALDDFRSASPSGVGGQDVAVLHCVPHYPVEDGEANLRAIAALAHLGVVPGYSDHTLGADACIAAVALGARVLEKHFTLDKRLSDFRDHQLSADPGEMTALVCAVRRVERMLGSGDISAAPGDPVASRLRRSMAAARNLPVGTVLTADDIIFVRPGTGYLPGQEDVLLGKRLCRDVRQGAIFTAEDIRG